MTRPDAAHVDAREVLVDFEQLGDLTRDTEAHVRAPSSRSRRPRRTRSTRA